MSIRVLLVDDHAIVREGIRQILADTHDIVVAGTVAGGVEAIAIVRKTACEVVVLDISMPDRSGIEVLKQLRKEFPKVAVLMLSMHSEDQYAMRSMKAGAAGYLNKQSAPAELVDAIRKVASGGKYITPALAEVLAAHVGEDADALPHQSLSDREYQALTMIASGKTVTDIAIELKLSVKTVSMYRSRLLLKMKLRNNAELTHYAVRNGLV